MCCIYYRESHLTSNTIWEALLLNLLLLGVVLKFVRQVITIIKLPLGKWNGADLPSIKHLSNSLWEWFRNRPPDGNRPGILESCHLPLGSPFSNGRAFANTPHNNLLFMPADEKQQQQQQITIFVLSILIEMSKLDFHLMNS